MAGIDIIQQRRTQDESDFNEPVTVQLAAAVAAGNTILFASGAASSLGTAAWWEGGITNLAGTPHEVLNDAATSGRRAVHLGSTTEFTSGNFLHTISGQTNGVVGDIIFEMDFVLSDVDVPVLQGTAQEDHPLSADVDSSVLSVDPPSGVDAIAIVIITNALSVAEGGYTVVDGINEGWVVNQEDVSRVTIAVNVFYDGEIPRATIDFTGRADWGRDTDISMIVVQGTGANPPSPGGPTPSMGETMGRRRRRRGRGRLTPRPF